MTRWGRGLARVCLGVLLLLGGLAHAEEGDQPETGRPEIDDADLPEILSVVVVGNVSLNRAGQARIAYHARQANISAVVLEVEDLDGARRSHLPAGDRRDRRRRSAASRASSCCPSRSRHRAGSEYAFTLLTDERNEGDPVSVDVDVAP